MKFTDKFDIFVALLLLASPLAVQIGFAKSVAVVAAIYSILSLSWFFMEKQAGWVSLAHSVPFGLAAYAVAINPVLLIPAFTLSVLLFFSISTLGRERFIFATFILTVIFWHSSHYLVLEVDGHYIGGEEGFSFSSVGLLNAYVLSAVVVVVTLLLLLLISKSSLGLKIAAARDDEIAARSVGIDIVQIRILSFAISITFASFAGICYILYFGHASPEVFSIEISLLPFIASLIAGRRWISPVLGSFIIVIVSRALTGLPEGHLILYAIVLILSPKLSRWWNAEGD